MNQLDEPDPGLEPGANHGGQRQHSVSYASAVSLHIYDNDTIHRVNMALRVTEIGLMARLLKGRYEIHSCIDMVSIPCYRRQHD